MGLKVVQQNDQRPYNRLRRIEDIGEGPCGHEQDPRSGALHCQ